MVNIDDIHIGDRVVIAKKYKFVLAGIEDEEQESLEVLMISFDRERVIIRASECGWPLFDLSPTDEPGNEEVLNSLRNIPNLYGWYINIEKIERVIPGSRHTQPAKLGVFDPLTSKVKSSKEELEQFKKDVDFFFRDLTKPYEAPEGAWAKWG